MCAALGAVDQTCCCLNSNGPRCLLHVDEMLLCSREAWMGEFKLGWLACDTWLVGCWAC